MPDHSEGEQHVFLLRAVPDCVDDVMPRGAEDAMGGDDANVIEAAGETPGHDVAGLEVSVDFLAAAGEERHQVGHATVIDIRVGPAQTPHPRICAEAAAHVFVYLALQVDAGGTEGANDDVGADAPVGREVAAWVTRSDGRGTVDGLSADRGI